MNVLEQHIEVNISAQKIASNVYRKLDPNEIDWILNKMVDRFSKDRIKEDKDSLGFDATQIDLDALRTLSVLDKVLPVYRPEGSTEEIFADLPGDYSFLINDSSGTIDKCSLYYPSAAKFKNLTKYIYKFELKEQTGNGPYYNKFSVKLNGANVLAVDSTSGLPKAEELFTFRYYLMNLLWNLELSGISFYWEKYDKIYARNSFIVVSDVALTNENSVTIDTTTTQATASTVIRPYPPVSNGIKYKPNRLIRGQVRADVLGGTFTGTKVNSPISAITQNKLKVYHDERFIVNKVKISYIRKPRKISLSLAQDCDLPEEYHMQICDMAVLYIKELILSPDWELKLQDNMLNKN